MVNPVKNCRNRCQGQEICCRILDNLPDRGQIRRLPAVRPGEFGAGTCRKGGSLAGTNYTGAYCNSLWRNRYRCAFRANDALETWENRWLERIGKLFHLNRVRLKHYDPGSGDGSAVAKVRDCTSSTATRGRQAVHPCGAERAGPAGSDRRAKALDSLVRHRGGHCVFVDRPDIPMDNNLPERIQRGPVSRDRGGSCRSAPTAWKAPGSPP